MLASWSKGIKTTNIKGTFKNLFLWKFLNIHQSRQNNEPLYPFSSSGCPHLANLVCLSQLPHIYSHACFVFLWSIYSETVDFRHHIISLQNFQHVSLTGKVFLKNNLSTIVTLNKNNSFISSYTQFIFISLKNVTSCVCIKNVSTNQDPNKLHI